MDPALVTYILESLLECGSYVFVGYLGYRFGAVIDAFWDRYFNDDPDSDTDSDSDSGDKNDSDKGQTGNDQ